MQGQTIDFRVDVHRTGQEHQVTLTAPRIHDRPTGTLKLDPTAPEWADFQNRIARHQTNEQLFHAQGAKLFDAVFADQHRISFEINYQYVKEDLERRSLRLQLRLLDPPVAELPWECLYNPLAKLWLSANPLTPLSRYVDAQVPPPLEMQPPLKLLIVTAEPAKLPPVNARDEVEAVREALSPLLRDEIIEARVLNHATRHLLSRAVAEYRPHLLHFVGHGQRVHNISGLVLETKSGGEELLHVDTLCELLQQAGHLRVAVLNACETSGAALALAKSGIAAIGMQDKISSQAAIPFCRSFYEGVASSVPLDVAANRARFNVRLDCGGHRPDWCLPALFLPGGRADLFRIDRNTRLVRVISDPSGVPIVLNGVRTSKTTPDTLVVSDSEEHEIQVVFKGQRASRAQLVAAGSRTPTQLDFQRTSTSGMLTIATDRPGARIMALRYGDSQATSIGNMGQRKGLGPVRLRPGRYRLTASWAASGGQAALTAEDEVLIRAGESAQAMMRFPNWLPAPGAGQAGRTLRNALFTAGIVAAALALSVLVYLVLPDGTPSPTPEPTGPPSAPSGVPQPPIAQPSPPVTVEMQMVSIPAGAARLGFRDTTTTMKLIVRHGLDSGSAMTSLLNTRPRTVRLQPYFIDRVEVTNAQYREFLSAARAGGGAWRHPSQPSSKTDYTPAAETWSSPRMNRADQAVVGIDWYDAYAFAKWAGKRLPTEDEWELAVRGSKGLAYPWGNTYSPGRCNAGDVSTTTSPVPAGQFAADRSPFGVLDMGGNVAEWTTTEHASAGRMLCRGGDWNTSPNDLYALTFFHRYAAKSTRGPAVGFRCVKDAKAGQAAPSGMILIEGGEVSLGGETSPMLEFLRSLPQSLARQKALLGDGPRTVYLNAFRIGQYEVTNAQYGRFLKAVQASGDASYRHPDQPAGKDHTPEYWRDPALNVANQPVVGVDWYDAYAYAKWAGMRLPTADEWEHAARGATENVYPWGDGFAASSCNGSEGSANGPVAAGSFPTDRSPFGVMDLGGNAMEWTATFYKGGSGTAILLKGSSWARPAKLYAAIYPRLVGAARSMRSKSLGFRCVQDTTSR